MRNRIIHAFFDFSVPVFVFQVVPVHKSSPEYLLQLIGDENTEIPDDIISAAIELLSAHQQKHQNCYVGFYKPSQIRLFTSQHNSVEVLQIDKYHWTRIL